MKTSIAFLCVLLVAGSAFAQQGAFNIAKQQAKGAAGTPSGGGQPASRPAATPPPASQQPNPALEATLQNIVNLRYDFEKFDSNPTNTLPLIKDLTAAAQGAQAKPASVSQLAGHLAAAIAGNKKLQAQEQRLAQNIHAIFNSAHLSATQQQSVLRQCPEDFAERRRGGRRRYKCDQRPQNDCSRDQIKLTGTSNARRAKNPATGLPESSDRFVRSAASWWILANGSTASMSSPSRCARSILRNMPICRRVNIWTNRKTIEQTGGLPVQITDETNRLSSADCGRVEFVRARTAHQCYEHNE